MCVCVTYILVPVHVQRVHNEVLVGHLWLAVKHKATVLCVNLLWCVNLLFYRNYLIVQIFESVLVCEGGLCLESI